MSGPASRTLYVTDLDGTLLRPDSTVSPRTAALLNDVIDDGCRLTYATARSFDSSRRATGSIRIELPALVYGGTISADPDTGAARDIQTMAAEVVDGIIAVSRSPGAPQPVLFTLEQGRDWIRWDEGRTSPGLERFLGHRVGDRRLRPIAPDDPLDRAAVFYVSVLATREALLAFRAALGSVLDHAAHFLSVDRHTPGLDWLEMHSASGTKAAAITRLATDVRATRIVVFGDNHNDVPMFRIADEGYAVADSVPELSSIATGVLPDVEDAVALWIVNDWRSRRVPGTAAHLPQ